MGPRAPGGNNKRLPGAEKGLSAPGDRKTRLPGAEKGSSALGGRRRSLPGGPGPIPGGVPVYLRWSEEMI